MSIVFPAIDMKDGNCVRLLRGDYAQQTVYGTDPAAMAKSFFDAGATHIHVVDLDGARDGLGKNLSAIEEMAKLGVFIQTGGGIRTLDDVRRRMDAGVSRCIIGTAAVENPDMVAKAAALYPGAIAVGIDERNGFVATRGWETDSGVKVLDLALKMKSFGVDTVIHTDISRDGMKTGPNMKKSVALMEQTGMNIVVSGGVGALSHVEDAVNNDLYGIIIGKALYDGEIDLLSALKLSEQ
ncbi:MAG: 1-(5-phosphoribosyl)-5-[(5-phosphoribosylamino)methylideneamino]imidazole-4-carboxamide isomerase [Clostridiales bacterium]|nr:1-(5-phosphoribosyl)-5-[(5-phosphoribosylamino)methylideneamino]imidazole-4-carboxamide isomerase [Clostridiales bacterium]